MAAPASLQTLCLQFVCPEVADEVPHLLEAPKGEEADMLKRKVHGVLSSFIKFHRVEQVLYKCISHEWTYVKSCPV
jgi:hypothetical protein